MPGIGKRKQTLYIDSRPKAPFATSGADGGAFDGSAAAGAIPVPPTIPAPTGLTLTPGLLQSAVTPSAKIDAVWSNLETNDQETYRVQVATDSGFTAVVGIWATGQNQASAVIQPLKISTTYYVRVQTIVGNSNSDWSATVSATTGADTTVPAAPSAQAGAFAGVGDFVVTWTNPTSANFRDVEITIYESASKVTLYGTFYDATQRFVWPAAANLAATSGAGDVSLYAELRSRSWGGVFSSAVNTGLITKSAPATPGTIVQSWSGDTGAAGADWTISWAAQADAAYYLLNINALGARRITSTTYTYSIDRNIADNAGADPSLSYSLIAVDGLNQSSTAATGTATNAAPAAPTVSAPTGDYVLVVQVTSAPAADFAAYEYVWKRDGTTVRTLESKASEQQYELSSAADAGSHSWTVVVRQKDLFGQYSSTTTSAAYVLDAFTLGFLRGGLAYSDSDANTFTPPASGTLAALKDGVTASGGVTYAA